MVKAELLVLQDHTPESKPVLVPRVAKEISGSEKPTKEVESWINEPLPLVPRTKDRDSSEGSPLRAMIVDPAKSSSKPPKPLSDKIPFPKSAPIEVGTPPFPGDEAVAIDRPLKFQ